MNQEIATTAIQAALDAGIREFCICPGGRCYPLLILLKQLSSVKTYYFFDESSASFFALGRAQASRRPVAIITTSGTATAHLLAAAMEAHYTNIPLIMMTADRPRRFRGSNAPQSCEQVGVYGLYSSINIDIADEETCCLKQWDRRSVAHMNICFEEPNNDQFTNVSSFNLEESLHEEQKYDHDLYNKKLDAFLQSASFPLVIVGSLKEDERNDVILFLESLGAPVYIEAISGIREDPRLQHLRIARSQNLWQAAARAQYPIDGILRIGGIPTLRLWRDLEEKKENILHFSINESPFSGLSWGEIVPIPPRIFFPSYKNKISISSERTLRWLSEDKIYQMKLLELFSEEPLAEPSLIHNLSKKIPRNSLVYLGNSLPIREWDLASTYEKRGYLHFANRGVNGIDGQTSTFLGLAQPEQSNWALLGDLTTLHDATAPWILPQIAPATVNLVVINNGGGKIFAPLFSLEELQNCHHIRFPSLATLWNMNYEEWRTIPKNLSCYGNHLIEMMPDEEASRRFIDKLRQI